ncbi:hypothetical protein ACX8Z9_04825 [Arthrobacter halodurans]|uniref:SPW repeat-containing protein n=1 Tax=Arthrobacter halodurans TaxID=516699 RepID=A0ABV4UTZ5_9MICC
MVTKDKPNGTEGAGQRHGVANAEDPVDDRHPPLVCSRRIVVLDSYAIAKGWFIAVVVWLVGALLLFLGLDASTVKEPGTLYIDNVSIWPVFAIVSVAAAIAIGLPLGLLLARLLRPVRNQWIHVGAFFAVPALLFAWPLGFLFGGGFPGGLMLGSLIGVCSAISRAAIIRNATIVDIAEPATGQQ